MLMSHHVGEWGAGESQWGGGGEQRPLCWSHSARVVQISPTLSFPRSPSASSQRTRPPAVWLPVTATASQMQILNLSTQCPPICPPTPTPCPPKLSRGV